MSRQRILVIDDEQDLCRVMKLNLERGGAYEVTVAYSGADGLAKAQAASFDLVITDFNMPGMDGAAVLDAVKTLNPRTAVLVFSVYHDDRGRITSSVHRKADGIITKPIDHAKLEAAIQRLLGPNGDGHGRA